MPKYVRNVTSGDYILNGEILTVNGKDSLSIRIIKGGIYEIDTHITYSNLHSALKAGDLVPAYEDKVEEVAEPDKATESAKVEEVTEVEKPVEAENPDESAEEEEPPVHESEETKEKDEEKPVADSTVVIPEEAPFICPHCGGEYASRNNLIRHIDSKHKNPEQ